MPVELILNLKKGMRLFRVSSILKKISPKTFGPHCVLSATFPRTFFRCHLYVFVNVDDFTFVTPLTAIYVLRIKDARL